MMLLWNIGLMAINKMSFYLYLLLREYVKDDGKKLNLGVRWKKYLTKFENFLVAMNITEDKRKVAMLLHFGGDNI